MMIRSKAPLRISFAGGGTDVSPYREEEGGVVLNATIDKYSYATLQIHATAQVSVRSLDYDLFAKYDADKPLPYDGQLDLVKAVINRLLPNHLDHGLGVFMHTDAPPGSGLGASSSSVVSVIGLFQRWQHLPLTSYDIAELAYDIERVDMAIQGGRQDQYAATFGGFNFIEFSREVTIVNPLRIPPEVINELQYNLMLCYTGKSRLSAGIIETQVDNYVKRKSEVVRAMGELKSITVALKNALLQGKLDEFGNLLNEAYDNKKKMAQQISPPFIEELYQAARKEGALGGKISGAGGGGFMFFYCRFDQKHRVAEALEKLGARVVDFHFEPQGLQTWEASG